MSQRRPLMLLPKKSHSAPNRPELEFGEIRTMKTGVGA
jgi:hypothetical protein